jgi:hypothetical protein
LLLEEMPPAIRLRPLLDAIGMGVHRITEVAGRIGQPVTSLSRPLSRLLELGLVRRESPYGTSEKSTKRSLYKISDPFFRFWFRVVAPHRAILEGAPARVRLELWRQAKSNLLGEAWEDLCRTSIASIEGGSSALARLGPWRPAGRFWGGSGPEWDVVSLSLDGKRLLVGEVKWMERPADKRALEAMAGRLLAKGRPPVEGSAGSDIAYALFVPKVRGRIRISGSVHVVTAEDVIGCLR